MNVRMTIIEDNVITNGTESLSLISNGSLDILSSISTHRNIISYTEQIMITLRAHKICCLLHLVWELE